MAKAKKKLLPKEFDALIKAGDLAALKAVFETCELDARGGYTKHTALSFHGCPDDLARWLVEQGGDVDARDSYGRTALYEQAGDWKGNVDLLLDLGADIQAVDTYGDTPLHRACKAANARNAKRLVARGARTDALNASKLTPLAAGLQQCSNIQIEGMADIAEALLAAGPSSTKPTGLGGLLKRALGGKAEPADDRAQLQSAVRKIGENFEFHRAGFNAESVDQVSAALDRLYALFDVPPVPRRIQHDARSPIVAAPGPWQDQQQELWELLVPSSGAADTVQGEVIRITGRIADEVERNGAVNWDADYKKMGQAFIAHMASGAALSPADLTRAADLLTHVRTQDGASRALCELSVRWVNQNPDPVPLAKPNYRR